MTRKHPRRWPIALRHDGRDYLTTAQVARVLGITPQSVYAYVSRGKLDSVRIAGIRGSLFAVVEVEALRTRTQHRPPAGVVERIRTEITLIEADRLYYRGRDATDLALTTDFLDVAEMLWNTTLLTDRVRQMEAIDMPAIPAAGRRLDAITMMVDILCAADASRDQIDSSAVATTARYLIGAIVDGLPVLGDPRAGVGLAHRLWVRLSPMVPTAPRLRLLNAALVLLADHDMSAGTIAARVAASARGSIYAVISAGLGAFDGPLHGGATTLAYDFLASVVADPRGPEVAIAAFLDTGQDPPGCGHIVYRNQDPRAEALLMALGAEGGRPEILAAVDAVRAAVEGRERSVITSDLALAAIALRYRMVPDAAETVFAVARIAGWVAHAIEEYREPQLRYRPQGMYTGIRPET